MPPFSVLREAAPERRRPRAGEQWRVNFEITAEGVDGTVVHIHEDGRVWTTTE